MNTRDDTFTITVNVTVRRLDVSLYSHDKALFLNYNLGTVIVTVKPLKPTVRKKIYVGTA